MSQPATYSSKTAGILIGGLLLLTFVLPFDAAFVSTEDGSSHLAVTWSWDLLQNFQGMSVESRVLMIGAWSVGLLALLFGVLLRGLTLSILYLILGIGAGGVIALTVRATAAWPAPPPPPEIAGIAGEVLLIVAAGVLAAFLLVGGIRARFPGGGVLRVAQLLTAVAVAAVLGVAMYVWVGRLVQTEFFVEGAPPGVESAGVFGLMMDALTAILVAAAALIAFWHCLGFQHSERTPARAANLLMLGALLLMGLRLLGTPAIIQQSAAVFLAALGPVVMIAGLGLMCLEAAVSIASEIAARLAKPPT